MEKYKDDSSPAEEMAPTRREERSNTPASARARKVRGDPCQATHQSGVSMEAYPHALKMADNTRDRAGEGDCPFSPTTNGRRRKKRRDLIGPAAEEYKERNFLIGSLTSQSLEDSGENN